MDLNHFSDYMRLNYQIFRLISETSELRGMKNFAIQNRVLQRDRVLQRRVLERYYCTSRKSVIVPALSKRAGQVFQRVAILVA